MSKELKIWKFATKIGQTFILRGTYEEYERPNSTRRKVIPPVRLEFDNYTKTATITDEDRAQMALDSDYCANGDFWLVEGYPKVIGEKKGPTIAAEPTPSKPVIEVTSGPRGTGGRKRAKASVANG